MTCVSDVDVILSIKCSNILRKKGLIRLNKPLFIDSLKLIRRQTILLKVHFSFAFKPAEKLTFYIVTIAIKIFDNVYFLPLGILFFHRKSS